MSIGSILPPDNTATMDSDSTPSSCNFPVINAATGAAPAGSTTIFERSSKNTIAAAISSSVTVTTSSQSSLITSNGTSPGQPTAIPSAILATLSRSEEHTSELQSRGHLVCGL